MGSKKYLILSGRTATLFSFLVIVCWVHVTPCIANNCKEARKIYRSAMKTPGYEQKVIQYQKAISFCPEYAEAHNNLADAYEHLGHFDDAIQEYSLALQYDSMLSYSYFGKGDTFVKIGLYEKAIIAYEAGLRIKPGDKLARQGLDYAKDKVANMKKLTQIDPTVEENDPGKNQSKLKKEEYGSSNEKRVIPAKMIISQLKKQSLILMGPGGVRQRESRIRFHNIYFDLDSDRIKQSSLQQLKEIGSALAASEFLNRKFIIEGHTDNTGSTQYNLNLSKKRAMAVFSYLASQEHIPKDRLIVKGHGESRPIVNNDTLDNKALNRRVEIVAVTNTYTDE